MIEVMLALPDACFVLDAVQALKKRPEFKNHLEALELALQEEHSSGIWGRKVRPADVLKPGDRLEIYRPLLVDPKLARKKRFKGQGKGRTGLFARRRMGAVAGY
jgi:sulfur carrier protein